MTSAADKSPAFLGIPNEILNDRELLRKTHSSHDLMRAIYDPCTFILNDSLEMGRQTESDADRKFRSERRKEKMELLTELRGVRGG